MLSLELHMSGALVVDEKDLPYFPLLMQTNVVAQIRNFSEFLVGKVGCENFK